MDNKKTSKIKNIDLKNINSFSDKTEFTPTYINLFYGSNGVGKTTIAEAITKAQKEYPDCEVLVFDKTFIDENFVKCDNLKQIYTLSKIDGTLLKEIENLEQQLKDAKKEKDDAEDDSTDAETDEEKENDNFSDLCWKVTETQRANFDMALDKLKRKEPLRDAILNVVNPQDINETELLNKCNTAFDKNLKFYDPIQPIPTNLYYKNNPNYGLLNEIIVGSSSSAYSSFIKALKNSDWVKTGLQAYQEKADANAEQGKHICPYCKNDISDTRLKEITECFNKEYSDKIEKLNKFKSDYITEIEIITTSINHANQSIIQALGGDGDELNKINSEITKIQKENEAIIDNKIKEPSKAVSIKDIDDLIISANNVIKLKNNEISSNNAIFNAKKETQTECKKEVLQLLAFKLKDSIKKHNENLKDIKERQEEAQDLINEIDEKIDEIKKEIKEKNKNTGNTHEVVQQINNQLKLAGFSGFYLKEIDTTNGTNIHHYEVYRGNAIAEKLSEGERNFIAFLYFYFQVIWTLSETQNSNKIIVIDDPVSSMDNKTLHIVSSLITNLINICSYNFDIDDTGSTSTSSFIKQIFILTHNVFFYNAITLGLKDNFNYITQYKITKSQGISDVVPCIRKKENSQTEYENYSPVTNPYKMLWQNYNEATDTNEIISIIRQILDYYFVQICSMTPTQIYDLIRKSNEIEDTQMPLVTSLLQCLSSHEFIYDDATSFDTDTDNGEAYKVLFEKIFIALKHEEHYKHMKNNK